MNVVDGEQQPRGNSQITSCTEASVLFSSEVVIMASEVTSQLQASGEAGLVERVEASTHRGAEG